MILRIVCILSLNMLLFISACSPAGTSTPVLNSQGTYSLETRTGIEDVDNVLAVVASGDRDQLEILIQYTTAPCTTREVLGGPPKCREGEADGTLVEGIPMIGSEGGFIRREEIDIWTGVDAASLFALYRVSEDGVVEEYYPRGDYAIVFLSDENGVATTLRITNGRIVRVDYPFYGSVPDLKNIAVRDASEVILMPDVR